MVRMMPTLAETIKESTRKHLLERGGLLFGQCVSAVGWIGGTVPELTEQQGIVELPTSDVAGPAFAVGAALAGRRPIFVCRYQGFMWYNAASIVNYAAKSKEMWGIQCPLFVRSIAMEGGIGPVAGGCHHSMIMRMPGIKVAAPMTSREWLEVWDTFLDGNDPIYCSEHRLAFQLGDDIPDVVHNRSEATLFGVSAARLRLPGVVKTMHDNTLEVSSFGVNWLKPFKPTEQQLDTLSNSKIGVVIDSDYATCGAAEHLALELTNKTGVPVFALGLADRTAGFAPSKDNLTPSVGEIVSFVSSKLHKE